MDTGDILVPTDFSDCSLRALDFALSWISPGGEVYLLNVLDHKFLEQFQDLGLGDREEATQRMRAKADEKLDAIIADRESSSARLNKMIVIGAPFVEILRIAKDLDFRLIVMGVKGGKNPLEELLFGGTADKVLRGTHIPIVCVP